MNVQWGYVLNYFLDGTRTFPESLLVAWQLVMVVKWPWASEVLEGLILSHLDWARVFPFPTVPGLYAKLSKADVDGSFKHKSSVDLLILFSVGKWMSVASLCFTRVVCDGIFNRSYAWFCVILSDGKFNYIYILHVGSFRNVLWPFCSHQCSFSVFKTDTDIVL